MNTETKSPSWSSFWFDKAAQDELQEELASELKSDGFDLSIMRLSSGRRAIANFVNILTEKNIPVTFLSSGNSSTDGKTVYISSNISNLNDFDPTVGLALHEASHIVLSDFELIKTLWGRISDLYKLGNDIGISKETVLKFTKLMVNYVEDRYIDNYIYSTAPGYRPYYVSLYNKYFNSEVVSKALKSELMREPTLAAYECRIVNLTNENTDLNALPGLRNIAKEISLKHIDRLKTQKDRITVGTKITKLVLSHIKDYIEETNNNFDPASSNGTEEGDIVFDIRVDSGDDSDNTDDKEDDILGGYVVGVEPKLPDENDNSSQHSLGDDTSKSKQFIKSLKKEIEKQKNFIEDHNNNKKPVSEKQKMYLDIIEKSGIVVIPIKVSEDGLPVVDIDCVVVKNMNEALIFSEMFPLSPFSDKDSADKGSDNISTAVEKGIQLGTKLGKKLKIRQEINVTKFPRRKSGKIDRRLLADIGLDSESIFFQEKYDRYDKLNLHISVDASSSMSHSKKWEKTMTMLVAICKAASMIENIRVTVSLRATICQTADKQGAHSLPYVVLAYDSSKDKFIKVKKLFRYLLPYGETPEGLAFSAIMDNLVCQKPGEINYFLNISDGEPCFHYVDFRGGSFVYDLNSGAKHTRKQYLKILQTGVKGMSYFIKSDYNQNENEKCFKKMYGTDAKFINVNDLVPIAKTMNQLFLDKD